MEAFYVDSGRSKVGDMPLGLETNVNPTGESQFSPLVVNAPSIDMLCDVFGLPGPKYCGISTLISEYATEHKLRLLIDEDFSRVAKSCNAKYDLETFESQEKSDIKDILEHCYLLPNALDDKTGFAFAKFEFYCWPTAEIHGTKLLGDTWQFFPASVPMCVFYQNCSPCSIVVSVSSDDTTHLKELYLNLSYHPDLPPNPLNTWWHRYFFNTLPCSTVDTQHIALVHNRVFFRAF